MKKLTALFLALALCLSLCTVTAFAAVDGSGTQADPWKIGKSGHESDVTAYWDNNTLYIQGTSTGEMKDFALPSDDSPNPAPWANYPISAVSIGSGVTKIGGYAFTGTNISSIIIPANVTLFGEGAFYDCDSITNVTFEAKTNIKNFAFQNCDNLTSVTMKSATPPTLGKNAFANCPNLKIFVPADNVKTYKTTAGWSNYVDKITTLWEIGKTTGTDDVTAYLLGNTLYIQGTGEMKDFTMYNTEQLWFASKDSITSVIIEDSVTSIGNNFMRGCSNLTNVSFSNGITGIGECAFLGCNSLASIEIPEGVTSIGTGAFQDCDKLEDVTIPSSVTFIGEEAFYSCGKLDTVICNATNPPNLDHDAFGDCADTLKIYVPAESVAKYKSKSALSWVPYTDKIAAYYTVTFNANGHGTAPAAITGIVSGSKINKPIDPTAAGYTFGGWYKEAGCTNKWNFATDTVAANTTLYAKWTKTGGGNRHGGSNPTVTSAATADMGIALYGVLSVSSLLGMGWVSKKKSNEE